MSSVVEVVVDQPSVIEVVAPGGPPGPQGPAGAPGPQGPAGTDGATGPGVATGGTTGQVLTKTSAVDFATAWQNPAPADLSTVPLLAPADDLRNTFNGAAGRLIISGKITGDTQPRLTVDTSGKLSWSGGTTAADITLARTTAGRLDITPGGLLIGGVAGEQCVFTNAGSMTITRNSTISAAYRTSVTGEAQNRLLITAEGRMLWGDGTTSGDVHIIRSAAGQLSITASSGTPALLLTNGTVTASAINAASTLNLTGATALLAARNLNGGAQWLGVRRATDSIDRINIDSDGRHAWGDGTTQDTTLLRLGPGQLQLSNRLAITNSSSAVALSTIISGDASSRFYINHDGTHNWGPGTATADTTLARSAVARLALTGMLTTTLGVQTKTKAGTPVDADWTTAPPDGTLVVDSTGNKLWARVGGVWKGVVIA